MAEQIKQLWHLLDANDPSNRTILDSAEATTAAAAIRLFADKRNERLTFEPPDTSNVALTYYVRMVDRVGKVGEVAPVYRVAPQ